MFKTYNEFRSPRPINGVGGSFALGEGDVPIVLQLPTGTKTITLRRVLYIPTMPLNLLCVDAFNQKGMTYSQDKNGAQITLERKDGTKSTILQGLPHGTHRRLEYSIAETMRHWNVPEDELANFDSTHAFLAINSAAPVPLLLFHKRMGHRDFQSCKRLAKHLGITLQGEEIQCPSCIAGKGAAKTKISQTLRSTRRGERQHADLGGPITPPTPHGEHYYLLIVDDMTRLVRIYLLRSKADAKFHLRRDLTWVETQTGLVVQFMRFDNGGEFKNEDLLAYLAKQGTQPEFTAPYTPEQNGAIERLHRTIWGLCRAIMHDSQLPKVLWGEILRTVVFIWNRSPNSSLADYMSPIEAWTGQPPRVEYFRRLGTRAWKLVPKALFPKKLDDRAGPYILVGYEAEHIYRLWNPTTGAIERAKQVIFDENVHLNPSHPYKPPVLSAMAKAPPAAEDILPPSQLDRLAQIPANEPSIPERQAAHIEAGNQRILNDQHCEPLDEAYPDNIAAFYNLPEDLLDDPNDRAPELLPQHLNFLADIERQIQRLELLLQNDTTELLPLYQKGRPRNLSQLDLDTYFTALEIHDSFEPKNYKTATTCANSEQWRLAMEDELNSLLKNSTWDLVDRSQATNVLSGKWVYKIKRASDGKIARYKARYVVRGFEQEYGIDYNETFASVVRQKTYRTLFAPAAINDWEIEQMDIKTAFHYGPVEETVFVELPEGFKQPGKVCKLKKALYGLKQAPRIWFKTLSKSLLELGFHQSKYDEAVFIRDGLILAVYVDDILLFGPSTSDIAQVKQQLRDKYDMTDLGACEFFLGTRIVRDRPRKKLWLSQSTYLRDSIRKLDLDPDGLASAYTPIDAAEELVPSPPDMLCNASEKRWYQQALGFLMFAMVGTRPDLAYSVSKLSRFMANPGRQHTSAVKRVLRYVNTTVNLALEFDGNSPMIQAWTDAEYGRDRFDSLSTECFLFKLAGGVINWKSRKQSVVATSSTESEYMALFSGSLEAVYLRGLLNELGSHTPTIPVTSDNRSAVELVNNPKFHERTKHIRIRFHKIRELQEDGTVKVTWTERTNNPADLGTKALPKDDFQKWRGELGMVELPERFRQ